MKYVLLTWILLTAATLSGWAESDDSGDLKRPAEASQSPTRIAKVKNLVVKGEPKTTNGEFRVAVYCTFELIEIPKRRLSGRIALKLLDASGTVVGRMESAEKWNRPFGWGKMAIEFSGSVKQEEWDKARKYELEIAP